MLAALPLLVAVVAASRLTARGAEKHSLSVANNLSESTSSWSGLGQTTSEATAISVGLQKRQGVESCKESSPVCKCETDFLLQLPFFHTPEDNLEKQYHWQPPLDGPTLTYGAPTSLLLLVNGKGFKVLSEKGVQFKCEVLESTSKFGSSPWWPDMVSVQGRRFSDAPNRFGVYDTILEASAPAMGWKQKDYMECKWKGKLALTRRSTDVSTLTSGMWGPQCLPVDVSAYESRLGIPVPLWENDVSCEWQPTHADVDDSSVFDDFKTACSPAIENESFWFSLFKTKSFKSVHRKDRCSYDTTAGKCLHRIGALHKPTHKFARNGVVAFIKK